MDKNKIVDVKTPVKEGTLMGGDCAFLSEIRLRELRSELATVNAKIDKETKKMEAKKTTIEK